METQMVKVRLGNREIEMSAQARLVLYLWLVSLVVSVVMLVVNPDSVGVKLFLLALNVAMAVLYVYAINCYVVGGCNILSWIAVALIGIYIVANVMVTVMTGGKMPFTPPAYKTVAAAAKR